MWVEVDRRATATDDVEIGLVVDVRDGVRKAATALEHSLESVRGAATALTATVGRISETDARFALEEVSLELSLSFGVEGGVVVAKGSAEASATVTLTWKAPPAR